MEVSKRPPRDANEAAFGLPQIATGEFETPKTLRAEKGAAARADRLTPRLWGNRPNR